MSLPKSSAGELWLPPPELTVSQWADSERFISVEASPEPGKWYTSRAEYQRAMMDAVKYTERVVVMSAAQVGKSELLLNTIGYFVTKEPCPILMVQPTLEMGEAFSKDRLTPMLRDTPCFDGMINLKTRNKNDNLLHKKFTNSATVTIAGANSPAGLASRPIRVLLCDEIDRYPLSAGKDGDPLTLATKRTANFWNRRIVYVSTPTVKGHSRIEEAYNLSTREEWYVPCPKCGHYQPYSWDALLWRGRDFPVMRCSRCGGEFPESSWKRGAGKWHPQSPGNPVRGFHVNAFASPWVRWDEIVSQYQEAYNGGDELLEVWTNSVLGESWENSDGVIELETVCSNVYDYKCDIPDEVIVLTAGIDTQDDRLECEVLGWGMNNQTWGIEYKVFYGDPGQDEVWESLDAYLLRVWHKASGEGLVVSCACIDSGGHNTDAVYRFCKSRLRRRVFPIIGRGGYGRPMVSKPTRNNRYRVPLFALGVSTIKGVLHTRLQAVKGQGGYCTWPSDERRGYDDMYFKGLLSERMTTVRLRGREVVRWEVHDMTARNEPLDCRVYAIGAYEILSPDLRIERKNRVFPDEGARVEKKPMIRRGLRVRRGLVL